MLNECRVSWVTESTDGEVLNEKILLIDDDVLNDIKAGDVPELIPLTDVDGSWLVIGAYALNYLMV